MALTTLAAFLDPSDLLARIYKQKGDINKAIAEYERLITFEPNSKDRRLIHPRFHYELAKLFEEKGFTEKAVREYAVDGISPSIRATPQKLVSRSSLKDFDMSPVSPCIG